MIRVQGLSLKRPAHPIATCHIRVCYLAHCWFKPTLSDIEPCSDWTNCGKLDEHNISSSLPPEHMMFIPKHGHWNQHTHCCNWIPCSCCNSCNPCILGPIITWISGSARTLSIPSLACWWTVYLGALRLDPLDCVFHRSILEQNWLAQFPCLIML
jgi:hypothetical protein